MTHLPTACARECQVSEMVKINLDEGRAYVAELSGLRGSRIARRPKRSQHPRWTEPGQALLGDIRTPTAIATLTLERHAF